MKGVNQTDSVFNAAIFDEFSHRSGDVDHFYLLFGLYSDTRRPEAVLSTLHLTSASMEGIHAIDLNNCARKMTMVPSRQHNRCYAPVTTEMTKKTRLKKKKVKS
jgi:hypothetical protein